MVANDRYVGLVNARAQGQACDSSSQVEERYVTDPDAAANVWGRPSQAARGALETGDDAALASRSHGDLIVLRATAPDEV